jgi:MurNAc alpha-1-phosphate uridylyltransferase
MLAHLVLVNNPPQHPHGDFALEGGLVRNHAPTRLTFSGLGVYRAALFDPVTPGSRHALAPLLRAHMAQGRVAGEYFPGEWDDIGTPQRLEALEARLQQRAAR